MATPQELLDALERESLVPQDLVDGLRGELRDGDVGPDAAERIARRLVAAGQIDQSTSDRLIGKQPPGSTTITGATPTGASPASGADPFADMGGGGTNDSFVQLGAASLSSPTLSSTSSPTGGAVRGATAPANPFAEDDDASAPGADKRRRKHVKKGRGNEFDSPLLLIGGGGLAVLLLTAGVLAFMLTQRSGDEVFETARQAYDSGSYSQAREAYEEFVEDFVGHSKWSTARVALAAVRIRQAIESGGNLDRALDVAIEEVTAVEDEPDFAAGRGEFASLLPRLAERLAEQADRSSARLTTAEGDDAEVARQVERVERTLAMVSNTKYVPKSLRDDTQLAEVRLRLDRVARRREAAADLSETLAAIASATEQGDASAAYNAHATLTQERPELRDDPRLRDALAAAVESERGSVSYRAEAADPITDPVTPAIRAALPLANPRTVGSGESSGVVIAQHRGVAYGVAASDGSLRWRAPTGESLVATPPVRVGDDVLLIDHRRGELVRIAAETGEPRWRAAVEPSGSQSTLTRPTVAGEQVAVASASGNVWRIDAASGRRLGATRFGQPLDTAVAVGDGGRRIYAVGRQSSVYTLDAESLECVAVRYTGHAAGSVSVAPIVLDRLLILAENVGSETCVVRTFRLDERDGSVAEQTGEARLAGAVTTQPIVDRRRVYVATTSGAAHVLELGGPDAAQPLLVVATLGGGSRGRSPGGDATARWLAPVGDDVWLAGDELVRASVSLAEARLVTRALNDPCVESRFLGPVELRGGLVLHQRVRRGAGLTVAASDPATGELVWETDLGPQPLCSPEFVAGLRGVRVATADGQLHVLGRSAVRGGGSPRPVVRPPRNAEFDHATPVAGGGIVFSRVGEATALAVRLAPTPRATPIRLPDRLACEPTPVAGAWLAPLRIGQIALLDAAGKSAAAAFQPRVEVGQTFNWRPAAVGEAAGSTVAWLTDGAREGFLLRVSPGQDASLERLERVTFQDTPITRSALAGDAAVVGLLGGRLAVFDAATLAPRGQASLPAEVVWGPYAAGPSRVIVAVEGGGLVGVAVGDEPVVAWQIDLAAQPAPGPPLTNGSGVLLATAGGRLLRLDPDTGETLGNADLGQRVGSQAVAYGPRLLLAAADATVLVVDAP